MGGGDLLQLGVKLGVGVVGGASRPESRPKLRALALR